MTKVYVKNPQDAPSGAKIQEGKRGGHYYESSGYKDNLVYDDEKSNDNIIILTEDLFDNQIRTTLSNFMSEGKVIKVNPPSEDEIRKQIEIAGLPKEINVIVIPYYCEAANAFNYVGGNDIYLLCGTPQTDKKLLESDIKILSDVGYDTKTFTWENRRVGTIIHENGHIRTWRRAGIKFNDTHWETKMHLKYSEYEEYILKYFKDKNNYINSYVLNKSLDAGVLSELIAEDFRLAWGGKASIIPHSYFYEEDLQYSKFRENRHHILRKLGLI